MYSLNNPDISDEAKERWPFYSMQRTGSYIIKDFFLIQNYRTCIRNSKNHYDQTSKNIEIIKHLGHPKLSDTATDMILAQAKELSAWTIEMENEGYHELYLHSFIGIWSSLEAGLENCFADFLENNYSTASNVVSQFKAGKFNLESWPWPKNECLDLASKLELRVKQINRDSGIDYFERLKIIFSWLDVEINVEDSHRYYLNEANRMRNIILHRNGNIDAKDVIDFPDLIQWEDSVMPFTEERFKKYYNAIIQTLLAIHYGTIEKVKREDLIPNFFTSSSPEV